MTNDERIRFLEAELERIGQSIQQSNRESELKALAAQTLAGKHAVGEYLPGVFDRHPNRDALLCDYYLSLFAEFETIKRDEYDAKKRGTDAHKLWLAGLFSHTPSYTQRASKLGVRIAEKIALSGVTAGIIWLGKTIIVNWPLGYTYTSDQIEHELDAPKPED